MELTSVEALSLLNNSELMNVEGNYSALNSDNKCNFLD